MRNKDGVKHEPICVGKKTCRKCFKSKRAIEFGSRKENPDGLSKDCRVCSAAQRLKNKHAQDALKHKIPNNDFNPSTLLIE